MPFVSKAQMRYMYAKHPKVAGRMAGETKNIDDLPEKVKTATEIGFLTKLQEEFAGQRESRLLNISNALREHIYKAAMVPSRMLSGNGFNPVPPPPPGVPAAPAIGGRRAGIAAGPASVPSNGTMTGSPAATGPR